MNRRTLLQLLATSIAACGIGAPLSGCRSKKQPYKEYISGAHHQRGHLLREGSFPQPTQKLKHSVVIIGGGIAGLSAARRLQKEGVSDIVLLELDNQAGGNALSGENPHARYPYGAHYLPIPNPDDTDLTDFLHEHGIITHYENGVPAYNQTDMCYAPHERLYYKGKWHEGVSATIAQAAPASFQRFTRLMEEYAAHTDTEGKYIFRLPIETSYTQHLCQHLDTISFRQFLQENAIDAEQVLWYADYCCRDDYGMGIDKVSAFAGIHYFTARRPRAANCSEGTILTWQEGNAHLADLLVSGFRQQVQQNSLVYKLNLYKDTVGVMVLDCHTVTTKELIADYCILCTPQFVTQRLLQELQPQRSQWMPAYTYAPWIVVTLTLNHRAQNILGEVHWDNILYGGDGLGYISANSQSLRSAYTQPVITWYKPLDKEQPSAARQKLIRISPQQLAESTIQEIESLHPHLAPYVEEVDAHLWGHGMITPVVGFYSLNNLGELQRPLDNRIFFAHSDLSGLSLFEEAFYQGNRAARQLVVAMKGNKSF